MRSWVVNRRKVFLTGLAVMPALARNAAGQGQQIAQELQSGDPEEAQTALVVDNTAINDLLRLVSFNIRKDPAAVAARTLDVAQGFVGMNQIQNPEMVEEFFGIFNMSARASSGAVLPFCAAGLSYCAAKAYCDYEVPHPIQYTDVNKRMIFSEALGDVNRLYFRPHPHVGVIAQDARARSKWLPSTTSAADIKPGYLVCFDWDGNAAGDHIGFVTSRSGSSVETIEFNTGKGSVLRKSRDIRFVLGFVRTY